jgi:integrase/recombinase XerD
MAQSKNKNPVPSYQSLARLQQMLSLRNLAERSREAYLVYVQKLALHFGRDSLQLDEAQAREYLIHLKEKRKYPPSSMRTVCAALRFFYQFVCERDWKLFDLVRSPSAQTLPAVLTREEVQRLIGCVREERFRVILILIYACGLRVGEAVGLVVRDMQPRQNRIHIRSGKGAKDRFVPATEETFAMLRKWWPQHRHPRLLFPGVGRGWREHGANPSGPANAGSADQPMSIGSIQQCVRVRPTPFWAASCNTRCPPARIACAISAGCIPPPGKNATSSRPSSPPGLSCGHAPGPARVTPALSALRSLHARRRRETRASPRTPVKPHRPGIKSDSSRAVHSRSAAPALSLGENRGDIVEQATSWQSPSLIQRRPSKSFRLTHTPGSFSRVLPPDRPRNTFRIGKPKVIHGPVQQGSCCGCAQHNPLGWADRSSTSTTVVLVFEERIA